MKRLKIDTAELVAGTGLLGLGMLGAGLALWWLPAALMTVGTILLSLALWKLR